MPRYDFECQACRGAFEVRASLPEYAALQKDKRVVCPMCGAKTVVRVFSPPSLPSSSSARGSGGPCCPGGKCR